MTISDPVQGFPVDDLNLEGLSDLQIRFLAGAAYAYFYA